MLSFWIIYVLTRPLGASLGDLLAQPADQGGLGLGTTVTSIAFLVAILGMVIYLSLSRVDVIDHGTRATDHGIDARTTSFEAVKPESSSRYGLAQTVVVVTILLVLGGVGYAARVNALAQDTGTSTPAAVAPAGAGAGQVAVAGPNASLGDLSSFRTITQDTLGCSSAVTSPEPPPASRTSRPPGTRRRDGSRPATRPPGPGSTARSTPCSSRCARAARTLPPRPAALNDLLASLG